MARVSIAMPAPMVVPADFAARVAPLVGAPFRFKGDDPSGWDCRGCARWIYREVLDVDVEDYHGAYDATDVTAAARRGLRADLIAERLSAWRPTPARAGAVVFLSWLGRAGHVGVMLDRRRFIHADQGVGTTIADLAAAHCAYSARGFYLPSFVTAVVEGRPAHG